MPRLLVAALLVSALMVLRTIVPDLPLLSHDGFRPHFEISVSLTL